MRWNVDTRCEICRNCKEYPVSTRNRMFIKKFMQNFSKCFIVDNPLRVEVDYLLATGPFPITSQKSPECNLHPGLIFSKQTLFFYQNLHQLFFSFPSSALALAFSSASGFFASALSFFALAFLSAISFLCSVSAISHLALALSFLA